MNQSEYNISISGDEARILLATMLQSTLRIPIAMSLNLYVKLNEISFAQPPITQNGPTKNN